MSAATGQLLHNLVLFGRVLRGLGLGVDPSRVADLAAAAGWVGLGRRRDFREAARALLVRRHEDDALFDAAFDAFWRKPAEGWTALDLRALGERRRFRRPRFGPPPLGDPRRAARDGAPPPSEEPPVIRATLTWSAREVLRHKDFAELTARELASVEALIGGIEWRVRERPSRRLRPGRGRLLDLRRTLRRSFGSGGEIVRWSRRERGRRPRPVVVLADISGSMERYTRLLLLFLYGLAAGLPQRVETFLFGTRLTRVSRQLAGRDLDRALAEVSRAVRDWSGGTRIGEALHEFNFRWARRVLGQGAVVLVISDGWDRGDTGVLEREMARLQRSSHRLVWLNPLLGSPEYEPLARGIRAALPYVDDFLPVHNLASLEQLGAHLAGLAGSRPARAQRPGVRGRPDDA